MSIKQTRLTAGFVVALIPATILAHLSKGISKADLRFNQW